MLIQEIDDFKKIRTKARAYFYYILSRNITPQHTIEDNIKNIKRDVDYYENIYILDNQGKQTLDNFSSHSLLQNVGKGEDRSDRAYFYKTFQERRCTLTNPYPSRLIGMMVVTVAYPVYDDKDELLNIVCIDISLEHILQMVHPSSIDSIFGTFSRVIYSLFAVALLLISSIFFVNGLTTFFDNGLNLHQISIGDMFESTILLTLSLAIFDLIKAIFEEEISGNYKSKHQKNINKTMIRFLGSIIIALSIEALMLVFKFAMISPNKLLYAIYLIGGISILLISLSIYIKVSEDNNRFLHK